MSTAFVELLQKSNLDYIITRKPFKVGSHSDEILLATFINKKSKQLQVVACLDKPDSVSIWSTSLDERALQLNARLLDLSELGETMVFLAERINESDFTLAKASSTTRNESSQINITFIHPKNKQSTTIQLDEHIDEGEKASFLSKILLYVYQRNEQLVAEVKSQQLRIKDLSTKAQHVYHDSNQLFDGNIGKGNLSKPQERTKMSLINPSTKRRRAATGVNYDDDDDSD